MRQAAKDRAARPAWQKRLSQLWALALVLGVSARVSHRLGGPEWLTGILVAMAVAMAVALLVRRIVAEVRAWRRR